MQKLQQCILVFFAFFAFLDSRKNLYRTCLHLSELIFEEKIDIANSMFHVRQSDSGLWSFSLLVIFVFDQIPLGHFSLCSVSLLVIFVFDQIPFGHFHSQSFLSLISIFSVILVFGHFYFLSFCLQSNSFGSFQSLVNFTFDPFFFVHITLVILV